MKRGLDVYNVLQETSNCVLKMLKIIFYDKHYIKIILFQKLKIAFSFKINFFLIFFFLSFFSFAQENHSKIEISEGITCIYSNGIPSHNIGKFPNKANPNKLIEQKLTFCFPTNPTLGNTTTKGLMTVGVTTSGIPIRPYTAEYFDQKSPKRYSNNSISGWRKQAMHNPKGLGIDLNHGHVDKTGLYHYHKISKKLSDIKNDLLIGYAPDGFKIVFNSDIIKSSWKLKKGLRPSPPGGSYDGEFEEDFEYIYESGPLDECNGKITDSEYKYYVTETYPFVPRCFKGNVNLNFIKRN